MHSAAYVMQQRCGIVLPFYPELSVSPDQCCFDASGNLLPKYNDGGKDTFTCNLHTAQKAEEVSQVLQAESTASSAAAYANQYPLQTSTARSCWGYQSETYQLH